MRIFVLLLALLGAPTAHLLAQVKVEVALDQEQFLIGESLIVPVRITNRSGQTLQLGSEPDWLTFSVESRDGFIVAKNGDAPVVGEFKIESGEVATRRVELAPYFALDRIGRYRVTATLRLKQWESQLTSKPASFDIVNGAKLWSQDFGVPGGEPGRPPVVRRYSLEQANYMRSQLRLYLRLSDAEGRVLKVFPLGPMVSFSQPERQLDKDSQLHVLWRSGARAFSYVIINPEGEVVVRQTHDYASSRPRLEVNKDDKLGVVGGVRRIGASDVPTPKPIEPDVATPQP